MSVVVLVLVVGCVTVDVLVEVMVLAGKVLVETEVMVEVQRAFLMQPVGQA